MRPTAQPCEKRPDRRNPKVATGMSTPSLPIELRPPGTLLGLPQTKPCCCFGSHRLCQYTHRRPRRSFPLPVLDAADSRPSRPSVFLSYASEDREAARLLKDAVTEFGLEVWQDESDLGGGEAWDQKIRRQIRECDYFMPVVSAQTQARHEGYFRREWRLAVERTLDMADDHLFLLPIVIDDTDQAVARVPEKFLAVQWLKVPGGRPTSALESLCRRVASGHMRRTPACRNSVGSAGKQQVSGTCTAKSAIPAGRTGSEDPILDRCGRMGRSLGLAALQAATRLDEDHCVCVARYSLRISL